MFDQFSYRETSMYDANDCSSIISRYDSNNMHRMQQGKHGNISNSRDVYIEKIDLSKFKKPVKKPTKKQLLKNQ